MSGLANDTSPSSSLQQCRICLSDDDEKEALISPCNCKGSIKFVHPSCLRSWRKALVSNGRHKDANRCSLCKRQLHIRARGWVSLISNHRVTQVILTALMLILLLIPAGYVMKALVIMSIRLTDGDDLINPMDVLWADITPKVSQVATSKSYPLYSPFPVCDPNVQSTSHALFTNPIAYWLLFPFSDDRSWHVILCKLQHFHLGFFFLGSVNNVWFTYKILGDMFDIVLGEVTQNNGAAVLSWRAQIIKTGLLLYSSMLVCVFWIHFNLFAFRTEATEIGTAAFRLKNFLAELPLWAVRWVTLGVAVGEFAVRSLYGWLRNAMYRVEEDEILSIDEQEEELSANTFPATAKAWFSRYVYALS